MKKIIFVFIVTICCSGCATERFHVSVKSAMGEPISGAKVCVGVPPTTAFWSRGKGFGGGSYYGKTDEKGEATVKFNCTSVNFEWCVRAEGYYRSNGFSEQFKDYDIIPIPPAYSKVVLYEHEKSGSAVLWPMHNPQPMYVYNGEDRMKELRDNGRYGFDLRVFDWLPPLGNGKVADFYYVRNRCDVERKSDMDFFAYLPEDGRPKLGDEIAYLEFDEGCGAYFRKKCGNDYFTGIYCAETNAVYLARIPKRIVKNGTRFLCEGPVLQNDECLVIRSRAKQDEHGNVVSAQYSLISGGYGLYGATGGGLAIFNPRYNDTNLECALNEKNDPIKLRPSDYKKQKMRKR